jgi:hypothetical protein
MAPRKATRRQDPSVEESNPNLDIYSDTTALLTDSIKSWAQVYEILEDEKSIPSDESSEGEDVLTINKLKEVAKSELHKVAARPKLLPYTDMIRWALDHVDISTRTICSHQRTIVGSFQPKDIQVMYKLSSNPKYVYNAPFVKEFEKDECTDYDRTVHDIVKTWWGNENKFKADSHGIYSTTSCDAHIMYVDMMLCRLYGKKNPAHFTIDWVPIIHEVAEGFTFDWGKLLSDNLVKQIEVYTARKSKGEHAPFYMFAYIMDAICFKTPFPLMNWNWTPTVTEPIHIYHSKLWEKNAKACFYEIFHNVFIPIHEVLYGNPPPRISEQIIGNLGAIAYWYIEENFSYIRFFCCYASSRALPIFLPDRLVCREVAYQTVSAGITKELKAAQKRVWPTYPIQVGVFSLSDFGHTKVEASTLDDITLSTIEFKKHDPHKVVENHLALLTTYFN